MTSLDVPAARFVRVLRHHRPSVDTRAQGAPDAPVAPAARMQKKTPQVRRNTGTPCAMVLRLIRALPGVPGLLASVAPRDRLPRNLIPAPGDQDHTISLVRGYLARHAKKPRPSHSKPASVTVATPPRIRIRTKREHTL